MIADLSCRTLFAFYGDNLVDALAEVDGKSNPSCVEIPELSLFLVVISSNQKGISSEALILPN